MLNRYQLILLVVLAMATATCAWAADDTAEFLDAMRERGMNDLALEFLDDAQSDRMVSGEFKKQIPYERGVTLISKWRDTPSSAERKRLAAQIKSELAKYSAANAGSPRTADAQQQLATLLNETAARAMTSLKTRPVASDEAGRTKKECRGQFVEARKLYAEVEKSLVDQLGKYPKVLDPKTQSDDIDRRRAMRARLAQVRVLKSQTLHEQAATFDEGSKDFKKLNQNAAEEFQTLYDKYGTFIVGFYARVYQGECYLAIGKKKEASGCFEDIIVQGGENPAVRSLVTKALALQAKIMQADGQVEELLAKQARWLATGRGDELRTPDWLALKFLVAEAKRKKASDGETKDAVKRKLTTQAREHYTDVSQRLGEYQSRAREILAAEFEGAEAEPERQKVKTFDEAMQAAKDSIRAMTIAQRTIPLAKQNNPEGVAGLEEQSAKGFADAIYYLDIAKALVDEDTLITKVNERRWLTCWLLWQDEQYYRSAVLASFIARRYPQDPAASNAAQVALSSYQSLFQKAVEAGGDDPGRAEAEILKDLASFITRRWGSSAMAEKAFGVLMHFSIRDQQFDAAIRLVGELPEEQRASYQAQIGNAIWQAQARAAAKKDTTIDRVALRAKAVELLEGSFAGLVGDPSATGTLAASSIFLTKARIEAGQYAEAIKLLEDKQSGALALVKTNNPVASRSAYATEAYKAALQAYVSVVPPQTDKAVAIMALLEKAYGKENSEQLTRIYLSLGVQLQRQIEELQAAGKLDEAKRVSEAFVAFLDKLTERGSSDPTVRQWMAQTYYRLAEGLEGDASATKVRARYYDRAASSFKQLMEDESTDLEGDRLIAVQLQYAQTLRHAQRFAEAMKVFETILLEKEMMIQAQKAAAYTLQEWGVAKDASKFDEAISGSGPLNAKGKHVVWGWNHLSKVATTIANRNAAMQPKYKELFYECWANIAEISYLKSQAGGNKTELLKKSRKLVTNMVKSYPDLLNMPVREQYDELMKNIQRGEGTPATGLKEILDKK